MWKVARGVTILQPGKDSYALAKSYRVISLLNCLGKMVEKAAAMLASQHCEASGNFHPDSIGAGQDDPEWMLLDWRWHRPRRPGRGGKSWASS